MRESEEASSRRQKRAPASYEGPNSRNRASCDFAAGGSALSTQMKNVSLRKVREKTAR